MPFEAKVFRLLIASPGDVGEERSVIPEIVNEWNALNSFNYKIILLPVKWETHSAPLLGGRPQAIINKQLVTDCDLLVGLFWTRIGTHTGVSISGTAEEIEQFVELGKPVMLYFSQTPVEPDRIDIEQFSKLKKFKENMRVQGLTESYNGITDFKNKFSRQLSINISNIIQSFLPTESTSAKKNKGKSLVSDKKQNEKKLLDLKANPLQHENLTEEKINEYLNLAVQSVANKGGWARIAAVGSYLQTFTPVNYKNYGYSKLQPFLQSRNIFEFKEEKGHPILRLIVS